MITKVSVKRGDRMRGLVEYLFGPGKRNEHTDQRVVAAYDDALLGAAPGEFDRAMVAADLDYPRRWYAPETNSEFVYHVSISNPVEDRDLSDEEWRVVAETAASRLGFGEPHSDRGVRWMAVRHGKSVNGDDHIHLVANLVREDGSKHRFPDSDWIALRHVAKEMETRFGLADRTAPVGAGTPELSRLEAQRQHVTGRESDRELIRRSVRSAATASRTESEFIAHARHNGLVLRPHWAKGGTAQVTGYSAARPTKETGTDTLVFFSGTRLGRDLTLPALRTGWGSDPEATAAWKAIDARTTTEQRRTPVADPRLMKEANQAMASARHRLKGIPVTDHQAWSAVARDGAGVLAAMAQDMPDRRVKLPLTRAAHALAGAAWREPHHHIARPPDGGGLWKVAQNALTIGGAQAEVYGTLVLLQQVTALAETIRDNREAAGRVAQARWAAQAAQHTRTAVDVIHTSPGPAWATQRQQARGLQPGGPHHRLSAAQLAGMFDPGPITNLGPRPSSRTQGEHERDRDRNDKDHGR